MYEKIFLKRNGADTCTYLMTYTAPRRIQGGMMGLRRVRPRDPNPPGMFYYVFNSGNRTTPQFNMLPVTLDVFVGKYEKLWSI